MNGISAGRDLKPPFRINGAFTLIELLAVVAVIAVLAALILPALSKARVKAETVICVNNVRQLTLGASLYTSDSSEMLSPSETRAGIVELPRLVDGNINPYVGSVSDATNTDLLRAKGPGRISPYISSVGTYHCPSDRSRWNLNLFGKGPFRVRSYSMNSAIVFGNQGLIGDSTSGFKYDPVAFVKSSDFRGVSPSQIYQFIDSHEQTISHGMFFISSSAPPPINTWIGSWPAGRHEQRCPISFFDGHVEVRQWRDIRTAPRIRRVEDLDNLQTGGVNNVDYQWLWDRTFDFSRL